MEFRNRLLVAAVCLLLAGPVATAHAQGPNIYSFDYVSTNLKKGVTTKAQVLDRFGEPTRKDVKLDSERGSVETYTYLQGGAPTAQTVPAKKKRGGGFGNLLRTVGGAASDVASITGKNYYGSGAYEGAYRAERAANLADRVSAASESDDAGDAPQASQGSGAGQTKLIIRIADGVVSGFEMES